MFVCVSKSPYSPNVDFALVQFAHCSYALISHQILHGRLYAIGHLYRLQTLGSITRWTSQGWR